MSGSTRTTSPLWAGATERSVTTKLTPEVHAKFEAIAKARGLTKGALARHLIKQFVDIREAHKGASI